MSSARRVLYALLMYTLFDINSARNGATLGPLIRALSPAGEQLLSFLAAKRILAPTDNVDESDENANESCDDE